MKTILVVRSTCAVVKRVKKFTLAKFRLVFNSPFSLLQRCLYSLKCNTIFQNNNFCTVHDITNLSSLWRRLSLSSLEGKGYHGSTTAGLNCLSSFASKNKPADCLWGGITNQLTRHDTSYLLEGFGRIPHFMIFKGLDLTIDLLGQYSVE